MSIPHRWPDDLEADRQWRRQQMALRSLAPGDVLAELDDLLRQEPDGQRHPLWAMAAHALGHTSQPGTPEGLWTVYRRLVDYAVEKLVEQRLSDPHAWEVD